MFVFAAPFANADPLALTSTALLQGGDNPVMGSEGDGSGGDGNYGLMAVIALGLIVVGFTCVKAGQWLSRREDQP